MNMWHKAAILAVTVGTMLSLATSSQAQEFPGLGVGNMWANEIAFQNQFYNWARQGSIQVARNMRPGEQLPFNAMTISNSINEGNKAFGGYMNGLYQSSNTNSRIANNYSNYAIRGNGFYGNGGPVYNLPYTHNYHTITNNGYIPGYHPNYGTPIGIVR